MSPSKKTKTAGAAPIEINSRLLRKHALPQHDPEDSKEDRGRVFVVAGSREMPGAAVLSATAALRAGAGKLLMACPKSIIQSVGMQLLESCVLELPETPGGELKLAGISAILARARGTRAALIGPGMRGGKALTGFIKHFLPILGDGLLILDAEALNCVADLLPTLAPFGERVILTPHAGEFASMTGIDIKEINRDPCSFARDYAVDHHVTMVLKGAQTFIARPSGEVYFHEGRNAGLGTSGSGDTLSGLMAGLAARGASPLEAAIWGVAAHAAAGDILVKEVGPIGFLASELLLRIPSRLEHLQNSHHR